MRVIAGQFRSRVLTAPPGNDTRPTSDRLRETLFNVLTPRLAGAQVLDLYAGSGAIGIEALSRGARLAVFVEPAERAIDALKKNLGVLKLSPPAAMVRSTKAERYLAGTTQPFDIVYIDPPWEDTEAYARSLQAIADQHTFMLSPGAVVVAEHRRRTPPAPVFGPLVRYRLLEQGDAALSFYSIPQSESVQPESAETEVSKPGHSESDGSPQA